MAPTFLRIGGQTQDFRVFDRFFPLGSTDMVVPDMSRHLWREWDARRRPQLYEEQVFKLPRWNTHRMDLLQTVTLFCPRMPYTLLGSDGLGIEGPGNTNHDGEAFNAWEAFLDTPETFQQFCHRWETSEKLLKHLHYTDERFYHDLMVLVDLCRERLRVQVEEYAPSKLEEYEEKWNLSEGHRYVLAFNAIAASVDRLTY